MHVQHTQKKQTLDFNHQSLFLQRDFLTSSFFYVSFVAGITQGDP